MEQKHSFAPSTFGAKADFVLPRLATHGGYQHRLAQAVQEPSSLLQCAVMVVNVHIIGVPALTSPAFLFLNSGERYYFLFFFIP